MGPAPGIPIPTDNFPLRGGKAQIYEGGIRVPLIVSWPGRVQPRQISEQLVSSEDLFATILHLAGIDRVHPRIHHSQSLYPMLTGQEVFDAGLVSRAVPGSEVMDTASRLAREVAARAPVSVARAKNVLSQAGHLTLDAVLDLESDALLACMNTEDWAEGIAAFHEKRAPRFVGK